MFLCDVVEDKLKRKTIHHKYTQSVRGISSASEVPSSDRDFAHSLCTILGKYTTCHIVVEYCANNYVVDTTCM